MMFSFTYGGKQGPTYSLEESSAFMAVRTNSRESVMIKDPASSASLSHEARQILDDFEMWDRFPNAGVDVLWTPNAGSVTEARAILKKEPDVRFAGRVLVDPESQAPVLYTENLFVKFQDDVKPSAGRALLKQYGLKVKGKVDYAHNAYFACAAEGTGFAIFEIAQKLLNEPAVELCHPELLRRRRARVAFVQQWHLKRTSVNNRTIDQSANVEAAWALSQGDGVTVAIIDDGVDIDHEEFRGAGKVVATRDVTRKIADPRPGNLDNHGTSCAGVAVGNGNFGASGVAPKAKLMPIRFASALGSQDEADAFVWAAQNGADVISCSWGPADGKWWDPNDPLHKQVVPLPDSTRLAMDFAVRTGRGGKGCVIVFAAGNGNESVDNDGYASYEKVIAVAASNDGGGRAAYSDFGKAIWCAFPSNNGNPSLTSGIWTTDRSGTVGYNPGQLDRGDRMGNYTNSFGGTSSAAPGVAGLAALIIARNPNLRWDEVRDIIRRSCDKIDLANAKYDADGRSAWYGFGRVNAKRAVEIALPAQPEPAVIVAARQDVKIPDLKSAQLSVAVAEMRPLKSIKVTVDIDHTYRGDLIVTLIPPASMGAANVVLHNRAGGAADNLKMAYAASGLPALAALNGKLPAGNWTLLVEDKARNDIGTLRGFTLEMQF